VTGAVLGTALLHPVADAVDWLDVHRVPSIHEVGFTRYVVARVRTAFAPGMLPMTLIFATVGAGMGALTGRIARGPGGAAPTGSLDPGLDLVGMIARGEGEQLEFKRSIRWDHALGRTNRMLEEPVVRTLAGFFNCRGGTLLVGVSDSGEVVGMDEDYATWKRSGQDGFSQFMVALVETRLGGDLCSRLHVNTVSAGARHVGVVTAEPSPRPVWVTEGGIARFYIRAGSTTRELDARETLGYAPRHWPGRES
jgi:hypothetical protein